MTKRRMEELCNEKIDQMLQQSREAHGHRELEKVDRYYQRRIAMQELKMVLMANWEEGKG